MTLRRRLITIGLALFVAAGVAFSLMSTTWHSQLKVPTGVANQNVAFTCGPLWGSGYVRGGPATTAYPISGTPCGTRSEDQVMVGIDIVLGLLGIAFVARWGREKVVSAPATL